ncbi:MAG: SDR family NAD(P)-dependent oxidoreductase [Nocardioidaceae bacterium]
MGEMEGRAAIVTGAATGIGAASGRALAGAGAAVVLADIAADAAEAVAEELREAGGQASAVALDVTDEEAWAEAVRRTVEQHGGLHALVNNAGVGTLPDCEQETREGWDTVIAVNQTGVWLGMRAVGEAMKAAGGGSIVNISSIFGTVGGFGASIAYHASKGAVRLMTKNAALLWAQQGIRVNSLHPGFIETPMLTEVDELGMRPLLIERTPMGRLGDPAEVAEAVLFLASPRSSYVTGSELYVDGGWTAQ